MNTKVCFHCKQIKSYKEFSPDKRRKDGLYSWCKSCRRTYLVELRETQPKYKLREKEYRQTQKENNPEIKLDYDRKYKANHLEDFRNVQRKWNKAHPDKRKKLNNTWRKNNRDKVNQIKREWIENNKETHLIQCRIRNQNRRARKKLVGGTISEEDWELLKQKYGNRCLCCNRNDVPLTIDHIIPLVLGGQNIISNIQPLCQSCNSSKYDKYIDYRPKDKVGDLPDTSMSV